MLFIIFLVLRSSMIYARNIHSMMMMMIMMMMMVNLNIVFVIGM